jgi:hypothetical protein
MGMLGAERWSSPVEVARKSRVPNVMRFPRAKVSPPMNANDCAIGVAGVTWHANDPLPSAPTVVVSGTGRQ